MEKLLVNEYGDCILYNIELNSIKSTPGDAVDVRNIFMAENDGQIVTENEVIDYKKGDLLLMVNRWNKDQSKYIVKAIVVTDIMARDDVMRFMQESGK